MDSAQDSNLAPFMGGFNQCENLSEIKESLVKPGCYKRSQKKLIQVEPKYDIFDGPDCKLPYKCEW